MARFWKSFQTSKTQLPALIYLYMYDVRKCRSNTTIQHNLSATTSAVWVFYVNSKIRTKTMLWRWRKKKQHSINDFDSTSWCSDWFPSSLKYWRCGMTKISCVPAIEFENRNFVDCFCLFTMFFVSRFSKKLSLYGAQSRNLLFRLNTLLYLSLSISLSLFSSHQNYKFLCSQ
jgi:hypothetical protein